MAYKVEKVDVWAADVVNKPGMLARSLESLTNAGADLEFIVGRRVTKNTSRIFVAPLKGKQQKRAAEDVGFMPAKGLYSLRIEGPNKIGLGTELTRALAGHEINVRGISGASVGSKSVIYFGLESEDDASKATKIAKKCLNPKAKRKK